ncbi:MAG: CRTAC1 family protein [Phycisphaerae bacterium]
MTRLSVCSILIAAVPIGCGSRLGDPSPTNHKAHRDAQPVEPWFDDVSVAAGIDFQHVRNATILYYFPEIMGAGVGLLDYNNDNLLDIYFVQSGPLLQPGATPIGNQLYENLGNMRFRNVTEAAHVGDTGYGMGVACGDYDNDGFTDIYVTNVGENQLYHNERDGTFRNVTSIAGVGDDRWSTSAAWLDYDRDGDLDLFVSNYVNWSLATELECKTPQGNRDYCQPTAYRAPARDTLYRNNNDGTFTDVTEPSGIAFAFGNGLGVTCGDFNNDDWIDIYVANDQMPNQLWISQQDGTFADNALMSGSALNAVGQAEAGMGVIAFDVENDGDLDLFMTHFNNETNTLYQNDDGNFRDITAIAGLAAPSLPFTSFGTGAADFNCDGFLDLYVVNGRVGLFLPQPDPANPYGEHNQLFVGLEGGKFREAQRIDGTKQPVIESSRGAAFGDLDRDGGIDVVISNSGGAARVLRNVQNNRGNWVSLDIRDRDNRPAIGATVRVVASGTVYYRSLMPHSSYCSSNSPFVHIAFGSASALEEVRVRWADGEMSRWKEIPLNTHTVLQRTAP